MLLKELDNNNNGNCLNIKFKVTVNINGKMVNVEKTVDGTYTLFFFYLCLLF